MNKRNIVRQNYQLVNAKYKLNTSEIKFIMTVIAQIKMEDPSFSIYHINISELEKQLQSKQNETRLKQFAKKLMSKPFEVKTERGWAIFNWFSKIEYINGEARFEVKIDDGLKPYLLNLKNHFVKCNLKYVLPLTSNYSIRIYQLLKEYENLTKRTFKIEELQGILQVPKSLKIYNRFKEKVIKVAEKELINNCDIFFEYEEIKTGKKVTELFFRIKDNTRFLKSSFIDEEEVEENLNIYIGKKISTTEGDKKISFITQEKKYIQVSFIDGGSAKIENIEMLKRGLV